MPSLPNIARSRLACRCSLRLELDGVDGTCVGATVTRVRFARLFICHIHLDCFTALLCFGFGMDLDGKVLVTVPAPNNF